MNDSVDIDEYMNDLEKSNVKKNDSPSENDGSGKEVDDEIDNESPIVEPEIYC